MKRTRLPLFLSTIGLLIVLSLMTGCYRSVAPDVTETPAAGADVAPSEEEQLATAAGADVVPSEEEQFATAAAESTRVAQAAETGESSPTETPTTPSPTQTQPPATATPTPTPTTSAPTTPEPTQAPSAGETTYVVQPGDNLFRIALRYDTTVEAIASANGIANPALIYVGQELTVPSSGAEPSPPPPGETYVVQPGDNLFRIALRHDMGYVYLAQYNDITNPANIYIGQVIRIP